MSEETHLWCCTLSDDGDSQAKQEPTVVSFRQEKKSSFLMETRTPLEIPKSPSIRVKHSKSSDTSEILFFLGGFQIVSNSRNIEISLKDKDNKEEYLTTSKGIPFEKGKSPDWYKAVCVIPGGPRPVKGLQLKLLSLKPNGETTAKVRMLKLTARLPDISSTSESASPMEHSTQKGPMSASQLPGVVPRGPTGISVQSPVESTGITREDLGAAMTSLSIIARSTEAAMEQSLTDKLGKMETSLSTTLSRFEQHTMSLTSVIVSQKATLDQQKAMMDAQGTMLQNQATQIETLLSQQSVLTRTVQELHGTVATLQHRQQEDAKHLRSILQSRNEQKDTQNEILKTSKHSVVEEDPIEGGIEQTLSNLEMDSKKDRGDTSESNGDPVKTQTKNVQLDSVGSKESDPLAKVEKIEVSLMGDETSPIKGHVHVPEQESIIEPESPLSPNDDLQKELAIATKERSFESRNDKNEAKLAGALDKIDIELKAGTDNDTVEVIEDTNMDENDRSPPDGSFGNLIDL